MATTSVVAGGGTEGVGGSKDLGAALRSDAPPVRGSPSPVLGIRREEIVPPAVFAGGFRLALPSIGMLGRCVSVGPTARPGGGGQTLSPFHGAMTALPEVNHGIQATRAQ